MQAATERRNLKGVGGGEWGKVIGGGKFVKSSHYFHSIK